MRMSGARQHYLTYPTIAFSFFLLIWIVWALDIATRFTTPGLLDDGTYFTVADFYRAHGFFHEIKSHFLSIFDPHADRRFYELHELPLGIYRWAFGFDLRYWYVIQFTYCLLTAAAGFWIVWSLSKNLAAAMLAAFGVLTVSPLADAVRGNFGKVEDIMTFAFMLSVALLIRLSRRWEVAPTAPDRAVLASVAASAAVFALLAALGKESGKILAVFPPLFVLLELAAPVLSRQWKDDGRVRNEIVGTFSGGAEKPPTLGFVTFSLCLGAVALSWVNDRGPY